MKDELPESFKKGLEAMERDGQKTTPSADKKATPTEKSEKETTPTLDKDKAPVLDHITFSQSDGSRSVL
jgi:hypothetical protein